MPRAKDIPEHAAKVAQARAQHDRSQEAATLRGELAGKSWAGMTPAEKDKAMRALLLEAGIIDATPGP